MKLQISNVSENPVKLMFRGEDGFESIVLAASDSTTVEAKSNLHVVELDGTESDDAFEAIKRIWPVAD